MGLINIKTSVSGEFTAKAVRGGARDSFKGAIPASGLSPAIRSKSGKLTMQLERASNGKLSGTISDAGSSSAFEADRRAFHCQDASTAASATCRQPCSGKFTMLPPADGRERSRWSGLRSSDCPYEWNSPRSREAPEWEELRLRKRSLAGGLHTALRLSR
jgi:hypothetical protein